ncbi:MerR family transcriptional regulator [Gordoniibacillus kamchatkensis]|uniref:MerR family transcriptional regulator n=1 Tax=Gordoniibacillus kamchatkensis TaxID=1590651 RepID=A0ABR5AL37_9BACL|nr:MerR family transcriptional regulator [Paenibacillus sp. VKM B-2647]KIL41230.1 MerR family transcriptional regulator [Paenibacillus sp. VKM B-2647]
MIRLGVIVSKAYLERLAPVQAHFGQRSDLLLLPYKQISEIKPLYAGHQADVDGFIMTELAYHHLQHEWESFPIPSYVYRIDEHDFYKCLFELSVRKRDLDFSRVFIDFLWESNDFLGLRSVLHEDQFPQTIRNMERVIFSERFYEETLQHHLNLWHEGKIDFAITRVGNIVDKLTECGIPHIYLFPSQASVIRQFEQVIGELEAVKLADNQIAIGHVSISKPDAATSNIYDLELKMMLLHKELLEFSTEKKVPFIIQKLTASFEIICSAKDLKLITNHFTGCSLMQFLHGQLPFSVAIGWGIGDTMYKARMNGQFANQQSSASAVRGTFIIRNDQIIGPLGEDNCLHYSNEVDSGIMQLNESTGISTLQIQKIRGVISKLGTSELTAEDIAFHLGVTVRSANRILSQLVEKGVAKVSFKKLEKLRGRPKKIYKIQFPVFS